jgi:hypothetical protein
MPFFATSITFQYQIFKRSAQISTVQFIKNPARFDTTSQDSRISQNPTKI